MSGTRWGDPKTQACWHVCILDPQARCTRRGEGVSAVSRSLSSGWHCKVTPRTAEPWGCQCLKGPAICGDSPVGSPMLLHRLGFCTRNVLPCLLLSRTWEVSGRSQAPEHRCNPACRALIGRVTWKLSNDTDPRWAWGSSAGRLSAFILRIPCCVFSDLLDTPQGLAVSCPPLFIDSLAPAQESTPAWL